MIDSIIIIIIKIIIIIHINFTVTENHYQDKNTPNWIFNLITLFSIDLLYHSKLKPFRKIQFSIVFFSIFDKNLHNGTYIYQFN